MLNKKNILFISPDFNYSCGVSKYVYSLLKGLSLNKSYKIFFITNGGDALDKLDNIKLTPHIMKFSKGSKNILNLSSNYKTLKYFCLKNEIDIIHTHHRYPEYLAYLVSKKTNIKTVTTVHSLVKGKKKFSFKSDKIIAVSNSVKNMLINYYRIPSRKIIMLYNFLEPLSLPNNSEQNLKTELGIPDDGKIILYLGRITKIKGVDVLIESFKLLKESYPKLYLLIVGQIYDSSLKPILKKLPYDAMLLNPVRETYPYYSIADMVVLPSRVEPLGYVMLESGLMQKPFIGSKTGGIAEIIENNVNGLLVEPGNVNELKYKISYLLEYPEKGKTLAENLYKKVLSNCSSEEYLKKIEEIYDELI